MSEKLYRVFCEICNWKLVTNGKDEAARKLVEIVTSPIPLGYPKIDSNTKQIVTSSPRKQIKKFKCPNCGRAVRPVQIEDVQNIITDKQDIKKRIEARNEEDWSAGRKESVEGRTISRLPSTGISSEEREGDGKVSE